MPLYSSEVGLPGTGTKPLVEFDEYDDDEDDGDGTDPYRQMGTV